MKDFKMKDFVLKFRRKKNKNKNKNKNKTPFPFLKLPREIRNQIYREVLVRPDRPELWIKYSLHRECWWDATRYCRCKYKSYIMHISPYQPLDLAILSTCKMIHEEALEVLYSGYKLWIDAPPAKAVEFLSSLPPSRRGKIRYLKLWLDPYLNCGKGTYLLHELSPEDVAIHQQRVKQELVDPWNDLFTLMATSMHNLATLCLYLTNNRSDQLANLAPIHPEWHGFYQQGWMEKLRDMMPQVETLLIEARRGDSEAPLSKAGERTFNELRSDLAQASGFVEESVQWESYFAVAGGMDFGMWPASQLCLSLKRRRALEPPEGKEQEESATGETRLDPLPPFVQTLTLDDAVWSPIQFCFGSRPPRSPDNNR
jgi:hypothetical protein